MKEFRKILEPLKRRILMSISRAVIETIKDDQGIQSMQASLLADEVQDDMERFQNYGLTSHPPKGSEGIAVFPGGDRSHGLLIVVDNRKYRLKGLQEGEVALYSDEGDYIKLKRGNQIEIVTHTLTVNATSAVNITTPSFNVTAPNSNFIGNVGIAGGLAMLNSNGGSGDINASGQVSDHTGSMDQMRGIYNGHNHSDPQGGTTGGPNQSM
ncbi:MAG: hypothetical protein A2048_01365 [Deltaproteobacteria bacterium GWA2_45_12]|nr:MAG: hypothetical protein A2048_01365 [Deltaproteobacteria bacterium GWA2_45_12]